MAQFGLRVAPVAWEIPSASLRAGSSLPLKNGSAQDDSRRVIVEPAPLPRNVQNLNKFGDVK